MGLILWKQSAAQHIVTVYRTAIILEHLENLENLEHLGKKRSPFLTVCVEGTSGKGGGDLLSRLRSTIGAAGLNFSVRNGKRWNPGAMTA